MPCEFLAPLSPLRFELHFRLAECSSLIQREKLSRDREGRGLGGAGGVGRGLCLGKKAPPASGLGMEGFCEAQGRACKSEPHALGAPPRTHSSARNRGAEP